MGLLPLTDLSKPRSRPASCAYKLGSVHYLCTADWRKPQHGIRGTFVSGKSRCDEDTHVGKAAIFHNNRCYFEKFYYNMFRLMYKQSSSD